MSQDELDFYPCLVDGAPASIYVNLRFEHAEPPPTDDTLYTIAIVMRERGEHGIGTEDEAAALNVVEESLIERAMRRAITYVGRVRSGGIWEIVFYGPDGHLSALRALATERVGDRRTEARSRRDARWSYYRDLLLPDAERKQWMDDRRMVTILREQGDRLATPRRVDHHLAFPTPAARDAFATLARTAGFDIELVDDLHVRAHRSDAIELDHIHDVVMTLADAALPLGGRYERWEAGIES